jgi:hypothetical protein
VAAVVESSELPQPATRSKMGTRAKANFTWRGRNTDASLSETAVDEQRLRRIWFRNSGV